MYPDFEWDWDKSDRNEAKHGISFSKATQIWKGLHLTVQDIARTENGERRGATMGLVAGELYTAIWTKRQGRIRLISVRRSRDGEKKAFYKALSL